MNENAKELKAELVPLMSAYELHTKELAEAAQANQRCMVQMRESLQATDKSIYEARLIAAVMGSTTDRLFTAMQAFVDFTFDFNNEFRKKLLRLSALADYDLRDDLNSFFDEGVKQQRESE